jgi:hypothetical protein
LGIAQDAGNFLDRLALSQKLGRQRVPKTVRVRLPRRQIA